MRECLKKQSFSEMFTHCERWRLVGVVVTVAIPDAELLATLWRLLSSRNNGSLKDERMNLLEEEEVLENPVSESDLLIFIIYDQ